MNIILLALTYVVGAGELILASFFWATHSKNEIRKIMALLALTTGLWIISSAVVAYQQDTLLFVYIDRLIFVFGAFLLTLLFHFSLIFPYPIYPFDRYHKILLYAPTLFIATLALTSKAITAGNFATPTFAGEVIPGAAYFHYNFYLLILFLFTIIVMKARLKRLDGVHLSLTKIMLAAVILGGLPAVIIDLLLPVRAPSLKPNYLIGNLLTAIWLGAVLYILKKKV